MKYLVPFAAVLLAGAILGLRSAQVRMESAPRETLTPPQPVREEVVHAGPVTEEGSRLLAPSSRQEGGLKAPRPAAPATIQPNLALVQRNMVTYFHRELGLSAEQCHHFESVLSDRQGKIESVQREVRASKVFVRRDYDLRINEIQASAYERMGTILDAAQYKRFSVILSERTQGDSIGITLDPDMTIVD